MGALLEKIQQGSDLTEAEAEDLISQMMEGKISEDEVKAVLLALREKGEALSEVVGAARAMRARALTVKTPEGRAVVDTCGTGGDGLHTVNVSTMAALVVAGAGVPVAKHGNRSITSVCGSADLLEALGVKIEVSASVVERCLETAHFGFLFAPRFHPAMKAVAAVRKALKVPTLFNLLGPLTNPVGVRHQVVGVARADSLELYAKALQALGSERALVVHGADGQDELSTTGPTEVAEIHSRKSANQIARYSVVPEAFGIRKVALSALKGGTAAQNARIAQGLLEREPGPVREAVLLNAAAALYVAGAAGDITTGVSLAAQALDRGRPLQVLETLRRLTHESA